MVAKFWYLIVEALFSENSHNLLLSTFRNATYEKVHLGLLQSFLKIKLKADSQLSEVKF